VTVKRTTPVTGRGDVDVAEVIAGVASILAGFLSSARQHAAAQ
jgi:hypothetical protein